MCKENSFKEKMRDQKFEKHHSKNGKLIFGIILMIVGGLFIANNLDLIPQDAKRIVFSWQMLLIGIGLLKISFDSKKTGGIIVLLIGSFFMAPKLMFIPVDLMKVFWPAIFLIVGSVLVFSNNKFFNLRKKKPFNKDEFNFVNIFSGGERIIESQDFTGGNITSIFGGSEINAINAKIINDSAEINILTIFGGMELRIPEDWEVKLETFSIFGGFNDERRNISANITNKKVLIVKGLVIFGGGEIKN